MSRGVGDFQMSKIRRLASSVTKATKSVLYLGMSSKGEREPIKL